MAEYVCKNGILRPITHIYQCVDRLVEGVDYEVYDWLKSDGKSVINTRQYIKDYREVNLYLRVRDFTRFDSTKYVAGAGTVQSNLGFGFSTSRTDDHYRITKASNQITNITSSMQGVHVLELRKPNVYGDGVSYGSSYVYYPCENRPLCLFGWGVTGGSASTGYISNLRVDDKIDLVPCKLLRDISPNLSSQKIAHKAEECGMYDNVSGLFFGRTTQTTGSFSVYND